MNSTGIRNDRGSAAVEIAAITPVLVALIMLVIFGGRVALTRQAVQTAAADAARAASIERTAATAKSAAIRAAQVSLNNQNLTCASSNVIVDVTQFARPVGTPASVVVRVVCAIATADLGLPLPGTVQSQATMTSPLDTYRERRR